MFPAVEVWKLSLNNDLAAPPAMAGSSAFFVLPGDRLAHYELVTGTLQWLIETKTSLAPAVGDGLVFVVEPDSLTAFSEQTGDVAWRLPFTDPVSIRPVWDNGWLVISTTAGDVLAFRAKDGTLIWRRPLGSPLHAPPTLAADRVYLPTSAGQVVALRVETGAVLWEKKIGGQPNDILALDNRVFLGSTDKYLYALEAKNGTLAWRWATGGDVIGAPVTDGRLVYFVSYDNVLRALNLSNGSQRWKRMLALRPTRGVVQAGDAVIVTGIARNALAFAQKDGQPAGDLPAGAELASLPYVLDTVVPPMLIVVTSDFADKTMVRALKRSYEPPSSLLTGPLPNPILPARPPGVPAETTPATSPTPPAKPGAPAPDLLTPTPSTR